MNIDGSQDVGYRYRMPRLITQQRGSGNGVHVIISNLPQVGKSLRLDHRVILKYWGLEIGTQVNHNTFRLNGHYPTQLLQTLLQNLIHLIVQCPMCHLPEIILKQRSIGLQMSCQACSYQGIVKSQAKIIDYILSIKDLQYTKSILETSRKTSNKTETSIESHKSCMEEEKEKEEIRQEKPHRWTVDLSDKAKEQRRREMQGIDYQTFLTIDKTTLRSLSTQYKDEVFILSRFEDIAIEKSFSLVQLPLILKQLISYNTLTLSNIQTWYERMRNPILKDIIQIAFFPKSESESEDDDEDEDET
jgi:translation initiation factor 2 beta subunit (eIF-2beta)/eIF-5